MAADWWSIVDVTLLGSGRTFTGEVLHPADVYLELDDDEMRQYWYLQTMNLLDSLLRRVGNVRMAIEITYVPASVRDLLRFAS